MSIIGTSAFSNTSISKLDIHEYATWWDESFASTSSNPILYCKELYSQGKRIKTLEINMTDILPNTFQDCCFNTLIIGEDVKTIGTNCFKNADIKKVFWLPNVVPSGANPIGTVNYYSSSEYKFKNAIRYPLLNSRFEIDGIIYVPTSNNQCDVIDCNYNSPFKSVNIDSTVIYKGRTMTVESINLYACYDNDCITGNIILSNVGDVGEYAFYNCCKATGSINVKNSGEIGKYAFYDCSKVSSLTVTNRGHVGDYAFQNCSARDGEINNRGHIRYKAFSNCHNLENLNIGNYGNIEKEAFCECTGLSTLNITNHGIIDENAFKDCKISGKAIIENSGSVGKEAFNNVKGGFDAIINNNGSLGYKAFCNSTMGILTVGEKVSSIGMECFADCSISKQSTITIKCPISEYAFKNAKGGFSVDILYSGVIPQFSFEYSEMNNVAIGNEITSIEQSAFAHSKMKSITISSSVKSIGDSAFCGAYGFSSIVLPDNVLSIGKSCFEDAGFYEIRLGSNLKVIPESTFSGSSLRSLFIPKNVSTIENFVFNSCTSLKTLIFEDKEGGAYSLGIGGTDTEKAPLFNTCWLDSVYIGGRLVYETKAPVYSPFYNNKHLRAVRFVDKEIAIYANEFLNCSILKDVYLGDNITYIGNHAFSGCTQLTHFSVGKSVKKIGASCFEGCSRLNNINLANTDTICYNAFGKCSSLSEIMIPRTTTIIQDNVFMGCTSLKKLVIEDRTEMLNLGSNGRNTSYKGLKGTGTPLFSDCPLDSIYIGGPIAYSKTQADGYSPFFYNESLRSVFINKKEVTVYENEFYNCMGLQCIKLGFGVENIERLAFHNCIGLLSFEFASTLKSIGANAFSDCSNIKTIISHALIPPVCDEQALEDINFWDCTVFVPQEALELYKAADQWKNFFFEPLVVEVTGDIDGDGEIDVADIQHIINMIVGTEDLITAADLNGDGDVDIADIQAIINIIISDANAGVKAMAPKRNQKEMPNADYVAYEQTNNTIDVSLNNDFTYSGFQMKVTLPEDVDITAVDFSNSRMGDLTKYVKKVAGGQYFIMGYSLDGDSIEGSEDTILTIHTSKPTQQDIAITDVVFSTPDAVAYKLPVVGGRVTGVKDIVISTMWVDGNTVFINNPESDTLLYIYSLNGSLVNRQALHHGVNSFILPRGQYVINKQKVFIGK